MTKNETNWLLGSDPETLLDRYRAHLSGEALAEVQQKQVLSALLPIMIAFVDLGFSIKAGDKFTSDSDIGFDDVLNSIILDATEHETAAPQTNLLE